VAGGERGAQQDSPAVGDQELLIWAGPVEAVHINMPMPLTPAGSGLPAHDVLLAPGGPSPATVNVRLGGSVEWRSTLEASATVTGLLRLSDNPVTRPRTLGPLDSLDPLSSTLGWDG